MPIKMTGHLSMSDLSPTKQTFNLTGNGNSSALDLLHNASHLTKAELKHCAQNGAVWLSNATGNIKKPSKPERLRRLKKIINTEQQLHFYYNPELMQSEAQPPTLIDDLGSYSVWLKPRGMLSQGSKWADHTALYRWVEMHYAPNAQARQSWIVHRLDRATQGIMLLAHSKKMAAQLTTLFEKNQIHKTYRALVWGKFYSERVTVNTPIDDKHATSHIQLIQSYAQANISLVEISIETGRKHQIRKHLSEQGFAIVGDRLYGNSEKDNQFIAMPDLQLTAFKLEFECPLTQKQLRFELLDEQIELLHQFDFKGY